MRGWPHGQHRLSRGTGGEDRWRYTQSQRHAEKHGTYRPSRKTRWPIALPPAPAAAQDQDAFVPQRRQRTSNGKVQRRVQRIRHRKRGDRNIRLRERRLQGHEHALIVAPRGTLRHRQCRTLQQFRDALRDVRRTRRGPRQLIGFRRMLRRAHGRLPAPPSVGHPHRPANEEAPPAAVRQKDRWLAAEHLIRPLP